MIMNSSSFINTNPILLSQRVSLSPGLGHTSGRSVDLVGCFLAVGRGRLTWIPVSPHYCRARKNRHPQAPTLLGGTRYIAWRLRCPFFRGMPTGPEAFLESQGVSGSRLDLPKKRPCGALVWSVGRTTNTDFLPAVKHNSSDGHFYLLY